MGSSSIATRPTSGAICSSIAGVAYGGYLGAGAEVGLSELAYVFAEFRRHWARGSHGGDFRGFGRFDMTANQMSLGVNLRF